MLDSLPITEILPELLASLRESTGVVVQAPTGSGKTTRIPPALLDSGLSGERQIIVLEPRRLAARTAAARMAQERNVRLGEEIGYQVRFDNRSSSRTRILVVTEGILLRRLQADPFLEQVGIVVFDEFHERSLASDLTLAMLRRVQQDVRPDLKLIVMSATLDPAPIARFLGDVPVICSRGRTFPVEIRYTSQNSSAKLPEQIAHGLTDLLPLTPGNLLAFLPRVRDIQQAADVVRGRFPEVQVLPLYGDLPYEQQQAVFQPGSVRKVILSTNVAETSLTIPGVTGVIDSGLVQQLRFVPGTGLDRLEVRRISQASADQRTGRAGRTAPGICLRLWPEREQRTLANITPPEIERVDITGAALELLCWGEHDLTTFPWFQAPAPHALQRALEILELLGAISGGRPTPLGERMVQFPTHPRVARMLLEGHRLGQPEAVAWAAALLTERDPFERTPTGPGSMPSHHHQCDVTERVRWLRNESRTPDHNAPFGRVSQGAVYGIRAAQKQLASLVRDLCGPITGSPVSDTEAIARALLAGYPDRVARRREPGSRTGAMVGGRGVKLANSSGVLQPDLFVCALGDDAPGEILVRWASGIQTEWLPESAVTSGIEIEFDPETERMRAWQRTRYAGMILAESATSPPANYDLSAALASAAAVDLSRVLPLDHAPVEQFLARVRCAREWLPELELPSFSEEDLRELLPTLARGCRTFAELRRAPWLQALQGLLDYQQLQTFDREVPEKLQVPTGSRITLQYAPGTAPVLAVRIQELFGWRETPRIASGRVPVVLHLLGPNYRPQQITSDLRSFWDNTYPEVRKELKRRYPKHAWPEDPWNATAVRKGPSQAK